jgi:hypothetical protein
MIVKFRSLALAASRTLAGSDTTLREAKPPEATVCP